MFGNPCHKEIQIDCLWCFKKKKIEVPSTELSLEQIFLFRFYFYVLIMYICMCLYVDLCMQVLWYWKSEKGVGSPGAGVRGGYEPFSVGAGVRFWVLWKQSTHS